ncbi:MAG TPA: 2Fe-2S iron-sulfur cluster-binding protein [Acidimicrobiales bacterium]|nr:2Fe-2S iron-sulfur cluster-binding protein [Acidimicrobiales bacterium]
MAPLVRFELDGRTVEVPDDGASLLEALRDRLGERSPKDGCSPQGQCGCCTVWVDGQPRVACVTPLRRVAGRRVTTLTGLPDRGVWADRLVATGGSQCGFCTPGIIMRLAAGGSLAAHLCRCTGWQTITEEPVACTRDLEAAARRAAIEGAARQRVGVEVPLGAGGFADDSAPLDALVAVPDGRGGYAVGETLTEARARAGKIQGRRTTRELHHPIEVPAGEWVRTLRTTWVEPAYLETDASWCEPGGEPASPLANGGAFGGKEGSPVMADARRLADELGRAVRVLWSREDAVRLGPKRPPLAAGVRADGTGEVVVARTAGIVEAIRSVAPGLEVTEVDVPGPPTALLRAPWAEAAILAGSPLRAAAVVSEDRVHVRVECGDPLDEIVLRSYCIGATHMALGWVRSEGIAVDPDGEVHDLTIRSFGIIRPAEMPHVEVEIVDADGPPVNGSDHVFAAVAGAEWARLGHPPSWPVQR